MCADQSCPSPSELLPAGLSAAEAEKIVCNRLGLTSTEARVVLLAAQGATVREVATALGRSEYTIKGHLERALLKSSASNTRQLGALVIAIVWWVTTAAAGAVPLRQPEGRIRDRLGLEPH